MLYPFFRQDEDSHFAKVDDVFAPDVRIVGLGEGGAVEVEVADTGETGPVVEEGVFYVDVVVLELFVLLVI